MDLSEDQLCRIGGVAREHDLTLVLLFGSIVSGGEHARSDLDVAVQCSGNGPDFRELASIQAELQEIFPEKEVDLALINHADPLFLKKITESCRLLAGDPRALAELKIYAFRRYQDHQRFFVMERAFVDRFVKERAGAR